jgi:hypothetical protein
LGFLENIDVATCSAQTLATFETKLQKQRHTRQRALFILAPATAAVLAVLIAFTLWPSDQPTLGSIRIKGKPSFSVIVKRDNKTFVGESNGVYRAHDQLAFQVNTVQESYFSLFNIEEAGKITMFAPLEKRPVMLVFPGNKVYLPDGIELDHSTGKEYLVGVFCPKIYEPHKAQKALQAWDLQKPSLDALIQASLYPDCSTYLFSMRKIEKHP